VPWSLVPVLNCGNQLKFIQTPTSSTIHYPLVNWIRFHFATPSRRSPTATGDLTRSQAHKLGRSCSRDTVRGAWAWHDGDSDARRPKSARSEGRDDAVCMTIRHHEEAWRSITSIIARQDPHRERSRWDHRRLGHRDCWNQVQYESHLGVRESIHVSWPALLLLHSSTARPALERSIIAPRSHCLRQHLQCHSGRRRIVRSRPSSVAPCISSRSTSWQGQCQQDTIRAAAKGMHSSDRTDPLHSAVDTLFGGRWS
jgi:hypothetical protein